MRLIHAVRELNESATSRSSVIALYTEPERDAMFVRHADEAYCLGPATVVDADGKRRSALPRLRGARARAASPRAPTPPGSGWGFVAEHPAFAELCERLGIVFVGPDAATSCARSATRSRPSGWPRQAGVPVAPVERRPGRDGRGGAASTRRGSASR